MKECVIIDGVRTPNGRAHAEKGWFRNVRPDVLLGKCYEALFARNPQVPPESVEAVFVGTANQSGMQNDIARFAWLAQGLPECVPTNGVNQQCPSGMACIEHAARAIIAGEGDTYIAAGVEDMQHVPMGANMDFPPRLLQRYALGDLPMGATAEKVARLYNITREDMELMAYWSNIRAKEARDAGKFKDEIVPVEGEDEAGNKFLVEHDQWIRDNVSMEAMAKLKPAFRPDGLLTAATSSPLTTGACAVLLMERSKADKLGLKYHLKYKAGVMVGLDPTIMGMGPLYAVRKLLDRTGLKVGDIDVWEINEAFASQSLACLRELGIEHNAPFKKTNLWGGALALGHPLGESGARIVITLNNIMKKDLPDAKYGCATLCGGFGQGNATLWEKVS